MNAAPSPSCRFCRAPLRHVVADLGMSPLANDFVPAARAAEMEPFYPLITYICDQCWLMQAADFHAADRIFRNDYAYFSSFSDSWLQHAARYVEQIIARLGLNSRSQVIEVASNDGYLLQYMLARGIPCLGIEPCANVAEAARAKGIPTRVEFFGERLARRLVAEGQTADLLIGNNVLAHVPDLNDFVAGLRQVLKPDGVLTMEFPHLLQLLAHNQFDTIYHEHFSYFSLLALERVFGAHGLRLFDVEELPTHGGSLRIYACRAECTGHANSGRLEALRQREEAAGLRRLSTYAAFGEQVRETKRQLLEFLIAAKRAGKRIAGYGAPAKGNTLLNYCGIRTDFLDYTVDRSPHKQGLLLPGTRIPIFHPDKLRETRPDYILILPWNLKDEIQQQMAHVREWGGRFVVPIPRVTVY